MLAIARWLAACLLAERDRWLLWLPVLFGCGIAVFFALPTEPPAWLWMTALPAPLALALPPLRRPGLARYAAFALLAVAAGFAMAQARAHMVAAPVMPWAGVFEVEGRVVFAEPRKNGQRLLLDRLEIGRVAPDETPLRVRITHRTKGAVFDAGDRVRFKARLQRPSGPSLPGAYDFSRRAWFEQLGGIGYAYGRVELVEAGTGSESADNVIANLRTRIAMAARRAIPDAAGAVAAALVTGLRADIPQSVWLDMQLAGLAHLLAISGLHMGLFAGTVFLFFRYALALVPAIALRVPVKKLAAGIAMLAAFFYLLLAGATIPTQRAFFMVVVGLGAIILDRNPFSMRLVALSALVVLATRPEALLGASFQMSFAAVIGLIAFYEQRRKPAAPGAARGGTDHVWLYLLGVATTTIIASIATAPFAAFHFQRIAIWGLIANLVAVPLTAFWIMPAGLIALALMPFGLDGPAFAVMGKGTEILLSIAHTAGEMPYAGMTVTQQPPVVLVLYALGGLWICLWREAWRWLGVAAWLLAMVIGVTASPPDILVAADGEMAAVRQVDGRISLAQWQRDNFVAGRWVDALGGGEDESFPKPGTGAQDGIACDDSGCLIERHGLKVAIARDAAAVAEDCRLADLVIATGGVNACDGPALFIGDNALWRSQGLAVFVGEDGIRWESVDDSRGDRLWNR